MSEISSKRKYDPQTSSLDEIIRCKKSEGVDFSHPDSGLRKRSKWDRYKGSDSDSNNEDDDDENDATFVGGQLSPSEESDEEEEPISIPLHGGCDEDSFFNSEGAEVADVVEEDGAESYVSENEEPEDMMGNINVPVARGLISNPLGLGYDEELYDDEPVDAIGTLSYTTAEEKLIKMTSIKRKADVKKIGSGLSQMAKKVSKPIKRIGSGVRAIARGITAAGARKKKSTAKIFDQMDEMEIEEITLSDSEDTPAPRPAAGKEKDVHSPEKYRQEMSKLQESINVEISKKDCSGLSLNDIIQKSRRYFNGSFNSNSNNSSLDTGSGFKPSGIVAQRKHGCPEEIVKQKLAKYWKMRYDLFSKFDQGIKLDYESWYSVTPEVVAERIANHCMIPNGIIIDAFCGCGGNSIQFAKLMKKVIAVDIDPVKIEYAKANAKIYGVSDKIQFLVGDFMELAPVLKADAVFLSPPWGGPSYLDAGVFDLRTMIPMDGFRVFELAQNISPNIAYFVPRTTSHEQLRELGAGSPVEIEDNMLNGRKITYTAYYGGLVGVNSASDKSEWSD